MEALPRYNNTHFNRAFYNNVPWRQMVICQEIGHNFGLGHVNRSTYSTAEYRFVYGLHERARTAVPAA